MAIIKSLQVVAAFAAAAVILSGCSHRPSALSLARDACSAVNLQPSPDDALTKNTDRAIHEATEAAHEDSRWRRLEGALKVRSEAIEMDIQANMITSLPANMTLQEWVKLRWNASPPMAKDARYFLEEQRVLETQCAIAKR